MSISRGPSRPPIFPLLAALLLATLSLAAGSLRATPPEIDPLEPPSEGGAARMSFWALEGLEGQEALDPEHAPAQQVRVGVLGVREILEPGVLIAARDRLIAVWYGLRGGSVALVARSPDAHLPRQTLGLRPGAVTSHRVVLRPGDGSKKQGPVSP